jgi:hypothetical protein
LGASTIKVDNPRLVFSETDSKLYTKIEICEEKNHKHFKNILIYKSNKLVMTKKFQEKSTYFRRWYKWCASR